MLEGLAHFLLRKRSHAALVAFLCGILSFILASVSVIIVALVTLRKGGREGLFVLGWGILPFLAHAYVDKNYLLLLLVVATFFFVWLMAVVLRHYASWGTLLDIFTLLGVAIVFGAYFFEADILPWWQQHINEYMQVVVAQGYIRANEVLSQDHVLLIAKLATSIEVVCLFLMSLIKVIVARWWEGIALKKTAYLRKELLQTCLSRWILWLFVLLLSAAILSRNLLLVSACLPVAGMYAIAGLCLLHYWLRDYKYAKLALFGFYVVIVIFPYIVGVVVLLGFVDSGFKLREVHRGNHSVGKDS